MKRNPLYASYVIHLIAEAAQVENEFARVAIYDEILDALNDMPAIYGCVLADEVLRIENYLSLRPERYEKIAKFAREGRLEFGPWFVDSPSDSLEMTIRNLQMGVNTLRLLDAPVVAAPLRADAHPQMPQILRGFGIEAAIMEKTPGGRAAEVITGLDGSSISVFAAPSLKKIDWEHARTTTAGRHLMARVSGGPRDWLRALDQWPNKPDEPFLSSRAAMVNAALMHMDSVSGDAPNAESVPGIGTSEIERLILQQLEPAAVWAVYEGSAPLKSPQRILQSIWRDLLGSQQTTAAGDVARVEQLLALYDDDDRISQMFSAESDGFEICAVKLRDDGQPGIILRGYNPTGDAHPVALRTWRHFTGCGVVRLDESRTGAGLPITDGVVQFTSNPHRITTLCLFDH